MSIANVLPRRRDADRDGSASGVGTERRHDARAAPNDSFENGIGRGVRVRHTAKIELELHRVRDQRGRTGVFQASHVDGSQPAGDDHTQHVAPSSGADLGHGPGSRQLPILSADVRFCPISARISPYVRLPDTVDRQSHQMSSVAGGLP